MHRKPSSTGPAAHMACFCHCLYTRIPVNEAANQTILGSKDSKKSLYAALTVSRDTLTTGLKLTLMYAPPLKFTRFFENLTAKKSTWYFSIVMKFKEST